nr:protein TOM three homolog 1-like [Tanacetum cinerariifolium]
MIYDLTYINDDPDVIHVDNSSDLALSTSLNDLGIAALHIDDVARGHGGDNGGDDRPPPYQVAGERAGCIPAKRPKTSGLKAITDKSGPVPIRFEVDDRETLMPLGDHAAHWANYLGELFREFPLHYPSWRQMPPERKARVVAKIRSMSEPTDSLLKAYYTINKVVYTIQIALWLIIWWKPIHMLVIISKIFLSGVYLL